MGLAIQHLGDQLCIIPLNCLHYNSSGNNVEFAGDAIEDNVAVAVAVANGDGEVMPAGTRHQQEDCMFLDSEVLFSDHFLLQQWGG